MNLQQALEKFGNREVNEDELEKLLKSSGRVKPEVNDEYCFISDRGFIKSSQWQDTQYDKYRWKTHNVFLTIKECKLALEIRKEFLDASFDPDWNDVDQLKWVIGYKANVNKSQVSCTYLYNYGCLYFKTKEIAQSLMDKFDEEDIKKYIFHIYK